MMMGLGFWLMFLVVSVPILLLIGLVLLAIKPLLTRMGMPLDGSPTITAQQGVQAICHDCGAGLLAEWAHCPRCGAPSTT